MTNNSVKGVAAGVPYLAVPPQKPTEDSPLVIIWHMMDAPRTEAAMAAALPLHDVPAWRVYFSLPQFGSRFPAGGLEEIMNLAAEDPVLKFYGPVLDQGVSEFPAALTELKEQLGISNNVPLGLVGGSAGGTVVLGILAETKIPVTAAVLVNPVVQLAREISWGERFFNMTYKWNDQARAVVDRFDFIEKADEILTRLPVSALLLIRGEQEETERAEPMVDLMATLNSRTKQPERVKAVTIPGMAHALAEQPGMEPAPQTAGAIHTNAAATQWLNQHLNGTVRD